MHLYVHGHNVILIHLCTAQKISTVNWFDLFILKTHHLHCIQLLGIAIGPSRENLSAMRGCSPEVCLNPVRAFDYSQQSVPFKACLFTPHNLSSHITHVSSVFQSCAICLYARALYSIRQSQFTTSVSPRQHTQQLCTQENDQYTSRPVCGDGNFSEQ